MSMHICAEFLKPQSQVSFCHQSVFITKSMPWVKATNLEFYICEMKLKLGQIVHQFQDAQDEDGVQDI